MKKHFFIFIFLLQSIVSFGQTEIEANGRTYTQIMDSLMSGLIPSRIPFGVLYNRTFPAANLTVWKQGETITTENAFQTWLELENSSFGEVNASYEEMKTAIRSANGVQPILLVDYQFAALDSAAILDGRLSVKEGILTDNGTGNAPYLTKNVQVAALAQETFFQGKTYTFALPQACYLHNTSRTLDSLVIVDSLNGSNRDKFYTEPYKYEC